MLSVDWAPNDREGDKLLFLFDCGDIGADEEHISLPADVAQLDDYVIDRISNRVRAAVQEPFFTYLEYGRSTPSTSSEKI